MLERDLHSLVDILMSAKQALMYMSGKTKAEFLENRLVQDAVIRRIEIVGEAGRRISEQTRLSLSQIPWTQIIGMRNFIVHEYDKVDLEVVWQVVQNNLPTLIAEIEKVVPAEDEQ